MPLQLPKPPKMHCSRISGVSRDSFCWNICAGRSKAPKSEIAFTARNHFALSLNCSIVPAAARLPIHDAPALVSRDARCPDVSSYRRVTTDMTGSAMTDVSPFFPPPTTISPPALSDCSSSYAFRRFRRTPPTGGMPQGGGVAGQDAFSARLYGLRARYGRPPYGGGAS